MNKKHVILLIAFIGIAAAAFAQSREAKEYFDQGRLAFNAKDYDQAIKEFNVAIRLDSNYADAYNGRGAAYSNKRDYDRAIADFSQAIQLNSKYADAYNNRGNVYLNKRDYDRAIADYEAVLRLAPNHANAKKNLAEAQKQVQTLAEERKIADYSQAIKLEPTASKYIDRGNAYANKKDYDRAIADYTEAIKLEPNASRYNNRGNAYNNKKDYDNAIADYDQAIKLDANFKWAYYNRGLVYYNKKDYDRAIADYDQAIKLDANYTSAYYNRGLVYYNKKDYARAIADYEAALRLDPNHANAKNNLAEAQKQYKPILEEERLKQVKEQIQKIVRFDGAYVLVNQFGIRAIRFDDKRLENVITAWLVESLQDTKGFNLTLGLEKNTNNIFDQYGNTFTPSNDKNTLRVKGRGSNNTETYVFRPFYPVAGKTFVRLSGSGNTFAYQFLNSSQYNTLGSNGRVIGGSSSTVFEYTYEYSAKGFFHEKTFLGEIVFRGRTADSTSPPSVMDFIFQVGPFLITPSIAGGVAAVWQEN